MDITEVNQVSAGILLYKKSPLQVYLAHMGGPFFYGKDAGAWSIPKGMVESGENLLDAAKREFQEETGYVPQGPFKELGSIKMKSGKSVFIWACEVPVDTTINLRSNTFQMEWPKGSGKMQTFPEMDKGEWYDIETANNKIVTSQREFLSRLSNMKNELLLKNLVNEVICESGELSLADTNKLISKSVTLEDFMKTLVGKKLKGLLDATSYARLYILNKYGVGSHPDENDVQANVAALMDNITAFINFRKLDGLSKQREEWDKEQYSKPEYKEWLKQRALAFKAYRDARDSKSPDAEELRKKYQTVASSDPTLSDYRKMTTDKETLVNQFHNTPLTVDDVLPGPDDTEADKKRWSAVEKSFNKLKNMNESKLKNLIKTLIKEVGEETGGEYPTATVQVFTGGGRQGTHLLLYKGDARTSNKSSDVSFKTPTQFVDVIRSLNQKGGTQTEEDVKSVLRNLTPKELVELVKEKVIVTTSIPNEILDLTGAHIPKGEMGSIQETISKSELLKIISESVDEVINEIDWSAPDLGNINIQRCMTMDQVVDFFNSELERVAVGGKASKGMPRISKGNIKLKLGTQEVEIETFIKLLTMPPKTIFDEGEKSKHSSGQGILTINTGIPALRGFVYDKDDSVTPFKVINTCPGAGKCAVDCYALQGFYIMNDGKNIKLAQRLQQIMQDPEGYTKQAYAEAELYAFKAKRENNILKIRWNDAGDFFVQRYFNAAVNITKKLWSNGYQVESYFYTKVAGLVNIAELLGFTVTQSLGGTDKLVSAKKKSVIVPKEVFVSYLVPTKGRGYKKDPITGKSEFASPTAREELRKKIFDYYHTDPEFSLLTLNDIKYTDELPGQEGEDGQYAVITLPAGDTDSPAQRKDVRYNFLLKH